MNKAELNAYIEAQVAAKVREKVVEIIGSVRMSHVEVSRTSAGKPSFGVKVYNIDPAAAANKAHEIESRMAIEYGFAERSAPTEPLFPRAQSPAPVEAPPPASQDAEIPEVDDDEALFRS